VAQSSTIHTFDIQLSDVDRGVYETLALKVARHPSEADDYLVTRMLAYCLEFTEGIAFSRGLSEPDEPAISVRDLTGERKAWIEIGAPDAARLHKASKSVPRVAVYTHKEPRSIVRQLAGERIHRIEALELFAIDRALIAAMVERLERRTAFEMTVTDGHLFIRIDGASLDGVVERVALDAAGRP
jgi:uncharacterized protein YaeQ